MILQCILGLKSQSFDFTNAFSQSVIPRRDSGSTGYFNSDGGQCDVVIRLNKNLYGQAEAAHLWYEKLINGLFDRCFVASNVDTCMFMSKIVICMVYVDDCLFWAR